jgi:hypothetical protein
MAHITAHKHYTHSEKEQCILVYTAIPYLFFASFWSFNPLAAHDLNTITFPSELPVETYLQPFLLLNQPIICGECFHMLYIGIVTVKGLNNRNT